MIYIDVHVYQIIVIKKEKKECVEPTTHKILLLFVQPAYENQLEIFCSE